MAVVGTTFYLSGFETFTATKCDKILSGDQPRIGDAGRPRIFYNILFSLQFVVLRWVPGRRSVSSARLCKRPHSRDLECVELSLHAFME
jgi:hypothetical protein